MILVKNRYFNSIFCLFIVIFCYVNPTSGQNIFSPWPKVATNNISFRQDTSIEFRKRNVSTAAEPDTNFTYEKYAAFLNKVSDTSKYVVLPLNDFRKTLNSKKIVIGLRHDVDNDLDIAYRFSETESNLGFRSTYFILHTAPYYLENSNNMSVHSSRILPTLKTMQNDRHFEIGWHNDLVTLQAVYDINPVEFLHNELSWLRTNGINIYGSASHGSPYCYTYLYLNFYFFKECESPVVGQFVNNISLPLNSGKTAMLKGDFSDFNLEYEAYFLNNNKYFSDATVVNGVRWDISKLDLNSLNPGDRVIILLHPIHWHKGSVIANLESFSIKGQKSSMIDAVNSTISVEMPAGTNKSSLLASFTLSPGAYTKALNRLQVSGSTLNNFNNPVTYTVYAENRDVHKDWIINVHTSRSSVSDFESFVIPGFTRSVFINKTTKSINVEVFEGTDLLNLPVKFELSSGARAWIGNDEQLSNTGSVNFSNIVYYRVLAEDGVSSSTWSVTVAKQKNLANFISFQLPGQIGKARIDTLKNTIIAEINPDQPVNYLKPSFVLSENAHAWIAQQEQISEVSIVDFTLPVVYNVASKDNLRIKNWEVIILKNTLSSKENASTNTRLLIYPNPSNGMVHLEFHDINSIPTKIDIYNILGEKVFTESIIKTGSFIIEADFSKFNEGVYIVRYSNSEKPFIMVILKP
jgi:hypothetical protein